MSTMEKASTSKIKSDLWIFTPTYFDVESFKMLREQVHALKLDEINRVHFIVLDDTGGLDPDIDEVKSFDDVVIHTPPFNLGNQRTIVNGLRENVSQVPDRDFVCVMDSDGEDRPVDIPKLLEKSIETNSVVLAERSRRQEGIRFKVMYFSFKLFFMIMTGKRLKSGNFSIGRAHTFKKIIPHPYFDLCYTSTFLALRFPIQRVKCPRGARFAGKSKTNFRNLIMYGIQTLMPFLDVIAIRSLILFSLAFVVGVISLSVVVGVRLLTDLAIPGWASSLSLVLVTFSFVALGNFLILFSNYSQSQGIAMNFLDKKALKKKEKRVAS